MSDNDQAAVDALIALKDFNNDTIFVCGYDVRIVIDAIRKGEVPIPGMVTEAVWRAAEAEVDRLRQELTESPMAALRSAINRLEDSAALRVERERLAQAVALLREADQVADKWLRFAEAEGLGTRSLSVLKEKLAAFLAGQPAPAKVVVDDAMVETMCTRIHGFAWSLNLHTDDAQKVRDGMRAALVAALEVGK